MQNSVNLTLIGFGEVGQIFARDFLARGDVRVTAYDLKFDAPETAGLMDKARAAGVIPAANPAAAASGADIVISAVTASSALAVAEDAATWLKPGGRLVYAVCSAEREEGEAQAARAADRLALLADPIGPQELPAGLLPTAQGWLRTDPGMLAGAGGLDGFFVARWKMEG